MVMKHMVYDLNVMSLMVKWEHTFIKQSPFYRWVHSSRTR